MLKQAAIPDIRSGKITRKDGYLVACMAYYPRGMKKTLIDEFRNNLAPDRELFAEWKNYEQRQGHEQKADIGEVFKSYPRYVQRLAQK